MKPEPIRHPLALLLLCAVLLSVQLATLTHAVDHPFHTHTEQCDAFLVFEHNASLLTFTLLMAIPLVGLVTPTPQQLKPGKARLRLASIRAPPATVTPR